MDFESHDSSPGRTEACRLRSNNSAKQPTKTRPTDDGFISDVKTRRARSQIIAVRQKQGYLNARAYERRRSTSSAACLSLHVSRCSTSLWPGKINKRLDKLTFRNFDSQTNLRNACKLGNDYLASGQGFVSHSSRLINEPTSANKGFSPLTISPVPVPSLSLALLESCSTAFVHHRSSSGLIHDHRKQNC